MRIENKYINDEGAKAIHEFLLEHHAKGDKLTPPMLRAWIYEAERNLDEGKPAQISLRSWCAVDGVARVFTVPARGISDEVLNV